MKEISSAVIKEVAQVVERSLENNDFVKLAERTAQAKRIFIAGEGRSGLVGKMIAMRLMHGGYHVYVTGETITPSIEKGDLLFILSGSGTTGSLASMGTTAAKTGAEVVSFTTDPDSPIAASSDQVIRVPAATKYRRENEPATIQPLGNQFDQSLHLLLDAFIIYLSKQQEDNHDSWKNRHANLE
ncbi:6-phospho-3-hexuloisomerase [Alkalicoccus daliensis]|uniref:6-phospho-3-hexuloisomerase n=1 Tax=Alkalicoccus daliensis TaxID=745820 RepID=A0A1H0G7T0_9BACI|nr:6-phospho-3-hexuloisomerase [Alkalicoccus daliensis]SDO02926.1 6-phospho-3-hexuloisomerase [Alkalicoccus daliensis]